MVDMSKATPGKWLVASNEDDSFDYDKLSITTDERCYAGMEDIATVAIGFNEEVDAEQRANATLIVTAVNSHPALMDALKGARDSLWFAHREIKHAKIAPDEDLALMETRIELIDEALSIAQENTNG